MVKHFKRNKPDLPTDILIKPLASASPLPSVTAKASAANSLVLELNVINRDNTFSTGLQKVCENSIRPMKTGMGDSRLSE